MFYDLVSESVNYINHNIKIKPTIGVILGSGLGNLVDSLEEKHDIPYHQIPHFPVSEVAGHAGKLVFGKIGNQEVMMMQGRFHYYEGFSMKEVTYPLFCMKLMGIKHVIVTNACGAINPEFKPGDIMIIDDFINSVGQNPLIGVNDDRFGPRFPDMSQPYHPELKKRAIKIADELGIKFKRGVYTFFQGPYYETAAEIKMYGMLGSDAIGMSTVPETIVANYLGLKIIGFACITNMATGIRKEKHSHQEVLEIANQVSTTLTKWVKQLILGIEETK